MVSKGEMWVFTRTASCSHIVKSGQAKFMMLMLYAFFSMLYAKFIMLKIRHSEIKGEVIFGIRRGEHSIRCSFLINSTK